VVTPAEREAAAAAAKARLEVLQDRLTRQVQAIRDGDQWKGWLWCAAKFHSYSFNNTMLIMLQQPGATQVAGYQTWLSVGRQVLKGERGIAILAPVVRRAKDESAKAGPAAETTKVDAQEAPRRVAGFTQAHVFDVSQTEGAPLPQRPEPQLLTG